MRLMIVAALIALPLIGCDSRGDEQPRVVVEEPWVQLPAVKGRPGTAYFRLETNSRPMHLVGISSPDVQRIELHQSREEGGVVRMEKLDNPGFEQDEMSFEPGGRHAMLFGIAPRVKAGDRIRLSFNFDPAPPVTVEAEVREAGAEAHGGH